jgi:predicted Zn-dependent peptidase
MLGDLDKSLVVAEGRLVKGVNPEAAEAALDAEINSLLSNPAPERELDKVKQKAEAGLVFGEMNHGNRALNLAYFEMLGDAGLANTQLESYRSVNTEMIRETARAVFREENASVLYYCAKNMKHAQPD